MNNFTRCFVLLLFMTWPFAAEAKKYAPEIPEPVTLAWCLDRAREANPGLARAAAVAAAERQRIVPAGALDDPRIAYEASNIPTGDFDFGSTPLSGHQLGFRQQLPFPGLLSNRRDAASRRSEASEFLVEDQLFLIDGAVEMAWAELGFSQQALEITNRNVFLLRQPSATAESRIKT